MKTMSDFTILCNPEQTERALKLGAPIMIKHVMGEDGIVKQYVPISPTAEELIGWLEEQGVTFEIIMATKNIAYFTMWKIDDRGARPIVGRFESDFSSRREATIAAIDTALDYLVNNNLLK